MASELHRGDRVTWNSEAGRVTGVILRKLTRPMRFKGFTVRASPEDPRYMIASEKTEHVAVHTRRALRKLPARRR